jgi:hypothetical protein
MSGIPAASHEKLIPLTGSFANAPSVSRRSDPPLCMLFIMFPAGNFHYCPSFD